jgi:hypothetical protein
MPLPVIETVVSAATLAQIEDGWRVWRAATAPADGTNSLEQRAQDDADVALLDAVILAFARNGRPFSANDMRPHIPEVRSALISGRLATACNAGLIRAVGYTPSTLPSTHNARVRVYAPRPEGVRAYDAAHTTTTVRSQ